MIMTNRRSSLAIAILHRLCSHIAGGAVAHPVFSECRAVTGGAGGGDPIGKRFFDGVRGIHPAQRSSYTDPVLEIGRNPCPYEYLLTWRCHLWYNPFVRVFKFLTRLHYSTQLYKLSIPKSAFFIQRMKILRFLCQLWGSVLNALGSVIQGCQCYGWPRMPD